MWRKRAKVSWKLRPTPSRPAGQLHSPSSVQFVDGIPFILSTFPTFCQDLPCPMGHVFTTLMFYSVCGCGSRCQSGIRVFGMGRYGSTWHGAYDIPERANMLICMRRVVLFRSRGSLARSVMLYYWNGSLLSLSLSLSLRLLCCPNKRCQKLRERRISSRNLSPPLFGQQSMSPSFGAS